MHPPCEMMVDSFLPAMREIVARKLSDEGYSQAKVATLLGVTQASVSLYLRNEGRSSELLSRLGISQDQARLYGAVLAEDLKKSPVYAVNTLYSLWSDSLGRGALCSAHRADYPGLGQCTMCVTRFGPSEDQSKGAIEKVASAVRTIEGSSIFVKLMPEVSVNIAYAPEGALSVADVVAVPGRIVKVNGLPRAFMSPEYGASTHVASVLLLVVSSDPSKRAAMNTRYDPKVDEMVKKMGLQTLRIDGGRDSMENLRAAVRQHRGGVDAVVDPGGQGTEPGLYLFAESPSAVVALGLRIARDYALAT